MSWPEERAKLMEIHAQMSREQIETELRAAHLTIMLIKQEMEQLKATQQTDRRMEDA